MKHLMSYTAVALEEQATGVTERELERVFYADVTPEFFKLAFQVEDQEQWQLRIEKPATDKSPALRGRFRVRKTMTPDGVTYTQAFKIDNPGSMVGAQDAAETPQIISEDTFEAAKSLCCEGMIKRRHFIKAGPGTPDAVLEVDAFFLPGGEMANWVKIDYERKPDAPEMPDFPEGIIELIDGTSQLPADREHIQKLYQELMISRR